MLCTQIESSVCCKLSLSNVVVSSLPFFLFWACYHLHIHMNFFVCTGDRVCLRSLDPVTEYNKFNSTDQSAANHWTVNISNIFWHTFTHFEKFYIVFFFICLFLKLEPFECYVVTFNTTELTCGTIFLVYISILSPVKLRLHCFQLTNKIYTAAVCSHFCEGEIELFSKNTHYMRWLIRIHTTSLNLR